MKCLTISDRCCGTCDRWHGERSLDSDCKKVYATEHKRGKCVGGSYNHHMTGVDGGCNLYNRMCGLK